MFEHPDDAGFHYSSDTEWDRAEAYQLGEFHPERAWVLTDRDVWHANPFYHGPKVPHPEDYEDEDFDNNPRRRPIGEVLTEREANRMEAAATRAMFLTGLVDDDIPF